MDGYASVLFAQSPCHMKQRVVCVHERNRGMFGLFAGY